MSKESDDLEELLKKATPGPWNVSTPVDGAPDFHVIQHGEYGHSDCGRYFSTSGQMSSYDATLIALAPTLAAEVLELRKLKAQLALALECIANLEEDQERHEAQLAAVTAERDALVGAVIERAEAIDPVLEVEFDTQMDVERNPYGAREAIEDALYLIRDLSTTLRASTAQPVGVRVRKLAWEESVKGRWIGTPPVKLSELAFWVFLRGSEFGRATKNGWEYYPTLDAAQAAAQADYEHRILAALLPEGGA